MARPAKAHGLSWRGDASSERLVCPRCRRVETGRLSIAFLEADSDALTCRRCAHRYPIVDGIPVVLHDDAAWTPTTPRDGLMVRAFQARLPSPLAARVRRHVRSLSGAILDLGCGGGALYDRHDVIGLDNTLAMARVFHGCAIVADAASPPFEPQRFDAVLLLNLLDSCVHPRLVLAQADALLRPGGTLLISCAYAWTAAVIAERRFTPRELLACLRGTSKSMWIQGRYRVVESLDPVAWRVTATTRLVQEYACHFVVARKRMRSGPRSG